MHVSPCSSLYARHQPRPCWCFVRGSTGDRFDLERASGRSSWVLDAEGAAEGTAHAGLLRRGNKKRLPTNPQLPWAETGSGRSAPGPPPAVHRLPGAAPLRARRNGPCWAVADPSWRKLKTAQPRFENSLPPPRPSAPSRQRGAPPLATTPRAQNAP